ncbi:MAG: strawberry notch C-terminal domain-containing protein, partial [Pyrinomonadaceae bacterium]
REGLEEVKKEDEFNVPRFLNRVLALDVERQNAIFDAYAELFDRTVAYAKANGTFDEGVADIKALSVRLAKQPRTVHADHLTGARTIHYALQIDRHSERVSFERAERTRGSKSGAFFRHQKKGHYILAVPAAHHTDPETGRSFQTFAVHRPEGERTNYVTESDRA